MWTGFGIYGKGWAKVARSEWVRRIWQGWMTYLARVCVSVSLGVGMGEFGQIWARMGKDGQVWMGHTDGAGMGDMASGWVWVGIQL